MKNQLTLEAFADWAEKQGDREYDYWDTRKCAVAQYGDFLGMAKDTSGFPTIWRTEFANDVNYLAASRQGAPNFVTLAVRIRERLAE